MPDPATLLTIGGGAVALSSAFSAVGAIQQGQAEANAAEYQADIARQQAQQERDASRQEEEDFRREQSRLFAKRRAALGGSGVESGVGSPLLASEDFASESELQALRIGQGGELRATRLNQQASLYDAQARNARTSGFVRGGSLLLSGVGRGASLWGQGVALEKKGN